VSSSRGVLKLITLLVSLFIRKQAVRKASPQNAGEHKNGQEV
jgi:hypothetical protein